MRIWIINRKLVLSIVFIFIFVGVSFFYLGDFGEMIVGVMNRDKTLPIYCVDQDQKKIAISFDAAWGDQYTDGILEILDKYHVKTTFFLVGFWVDKYPDMVKKIHDKGHEVGNHSSTHPHMSKLSMEQISKELNETGEKIEKITGKKPILFRPPFGDYNNRLIDTAKENGYYTIQWDVDSLDWKELGTQPVVDRVTRNVKNGSIVLFHNNAKYVVEYLPLVIERLQKEGYEIVPISQLIIKKDFYIDHTGMQKCKEEKE
ncbi:polysaccharide deacetylase family sporulation protein PdaB [Crassaminicella profunda]|uniref:polysaccharide deacetylase family sporulation protein PdaB n=1 Tax=Crassaminicella profunda TaxID=1286698 RepID=UPI001CA71E44|nr:polysaccharide deacetylase family sporulation protein PdaB [Crassaminicella profunda]QZY56251.1 polysaccharide deacetylase family sporulation protein PdaB [Crassaminicella profunda]